MASPFPGMDPYLEQPDFWSSFHSRFIVAIADALYPHLTPKYYVEVEVRAYLDTLDESLCIGIPDAVLLAARTAQTNVEPTAQTNVDNSMYSSQVTVQTVDVPMPTEVRERYLTIRRVGTNEVITAIELLSPSNKRRGRGREEYEAKRQLIFGSRTHLVEIDLLRGGEPLPLQGVMTPSDYRVLISRSESRPKADLYSFSLRQPLPTIAIPLTRSDASVSINLQEIFAGVYQRSDYDIRIDYQTEAMPPPELSESDRQWMRASISQFSFLAGSPALYLKDERRDESRAVDDTP
jgi:hypothetical protein